MVLKIFFSFEECQESSLKVGNNRMGKITQGAPSDFVVDFLLDILWHPLPRIHEIECMFAVSLDIVCHDMDSRADILLFYFDTDFLLDLSYSTSKW